jgi:thymidylate kinase
MLAGVLAEERLSYCILHGWQPWPQASPSDVDIATTADDLGRLEETLRCGRCGRLVQLLQHEASGYYFVLAAPHGQAMRFIALDVATDYRCGGRIFFSAQDLLRHRRWVNGLWVAAPQMELAYLLVKKISKRVLPEHQKSNLRALCSSLGEEAYTTGRRLLGARWGTLVIDWLVRSDWMTFERHLPRLRRMLRWQAAKRDPLGLVRYWLSDARRWWRRWSYPTGLCVAVLGPDGAGKSTLVNRLGEDLLGAFRRTAVFHLRPTLIDKKPERGPVTDPHGKAPYPFWVSLLKIPYYVLTYGLGYLFHVRPRLVRSALVLFDRYYDDILVDPRRYRYAGPMGFARLGRRLIHNPDLYFIVDVPEEEVWTRKQEVSREEVGRQRDTYRRLAADLPGAVLLDGSLPVDEVARNAGDVIVDYLRHRYISRRYIWFFDDETAALASLAPALCSSGDAVFAPSPARPRGENSQPVSGPTFAWVAPQDGRRYLIPLEPRAAAARALDLWSVRGAVEGVTKGFLGAMLRLGMGRYVIPAVQLVIPRGGSGNGSGNGLLLEYLESVLGYRGLSAAVSLGPRRKPVLLLLSREGKRVAYVKIGGNAVANSLVQHETDVLKELGRQSFHSFVTPRVLHSGWWNGRYVCVQSAPEGGATRTPQRLTAQYLSIARELASVSTEWVTLADSDFWRSLLAQVDRVPNTHFQNTLKQSIRRAEDWLGDELLPFHFSHGDFGPWNMKRLREKVFVFDWEDASKARPPGWDILHFLFQGRFSSKRRPHELCATLLADAVACATMDSHLAGFGLRSTPWRFFLFLYLLNRLAFRGGLLSQDAGAFPEVQTLAGCLHALNDSR